MTETRTFVHRTERGELKLSIPAPSVFVFEYDGFADESFVDFAEQVWEKTLGASPDPVQVFADTERQTGYASGFRTRLMEWSQRMVHRTDVYCLLVKSRWVAMGIAIVRATVGLPAAHAEVTASREVFRAKLDQAITRSELRASA